MADGVGADTVERSHAVNISLLHGIIVLMQYSVVVL